MRRMPPRLATMAAAFDYVEVPGHRLAVVRGTCDCRRHYAVRPTYVLPLSRSSKYQPPYGGAGVAAAFSLDPGVEWVDRERTRPVSFSTHRNAVLDAAPPDVLALVAFLRAKGLVVELYGSRALTDAPVTQTSDWDFLVFGDDFGHAVKSLVESGMGVRLRGATLSRLVDGYPHYRRVAARRDLEGITRTCATFFHVGQWAVDLYYGGCAGDPPVAIPHHIHGPPRSLTGVLCESGGASFRMPRRVVVRLGTGQTITILHTAWLLAGLETLAGTTVRLDNVRRVSPRRYWLSPWASRLSILGKVP